MVEPCWRAVGIPAILMAAAGLGASLGAAAAWLLFSRPEEDDLQPAREPALPLAGRSARPAVAARGGRAAPGAPGNPKAEERKRRRAAAKDAAARAAAAQADAAREAAAAAASSAARAASCAEAPAAAALVTAAAAGGGASSAQAAPPSVPSTGSGAASAPAIGAADALAQAPAPVALAGAPGGPPPRRDLVCADALEWLRPGAVPPRSLVLTGIPDVCEVQNFAPTKQAWEVWFARAAKSVLEALPPRCVAVFVQTDIRETGGGQVSKFALVLRAAAEVKGTKLLWHKVAHFGTVDESCQGCVKYSHLICFQQCPEEAEPEPVCGIPDVLWRGLKPRGLKNAVRCFGVNMTRVIILWASRQLGVETVVDPFCGAGTVCAIGNALGLHAIGVDISPRRVKQAGVLDGEALLAYERDVVSSASHRQSASADLAGTGVRMSGRARKKAFAGFRGMSKVLLKDAQKGERV